MFHLFVESNYYSFLFYMYCAIYINVFEFLSLAKIFFLCGFSYWSSSGSRRPLESQFFCSFTFRLLFTKIGILSGFNIIHIVWQLSIVMLELNSTYIKRVEIYSFFIYTMNIMTLKLCSEIPISYPLQPMNVIRRSFVLMWVLKCVKIFLT